MAGVALAQTPRLLTQFDAGSTIYLKSGEGFQIQLERRADETKAWRWPFIDEKVVKVAAPMRESRPADKPNTVLEIHSFIAVAPGATNLYAELTEAGDPTKVFARFPVTVQVTIAPAGAPASPP
jgi:hypothetical protein